MAVKVIEEHEYEALLERLEMLERKVNRLEETQVQYLTTEQACERLQCGRDKLDSLRKKGRVEWVMNGSQYRYLTTSINACYDRIEKGKVLGKKLAPG